MNRRALTALGALAIGAAACQALLGIDNTRPDASLGEAGADAAPDAIDPCTLRGEPSPSLDAGPGAPSESWTFALHRIAYGLDGSAGAVQALNLDRVCTCPGAKSPPAGRVDESCTRPPGVTLRCDGPKGEDNAGLQLLSFIATAVPEATLNALLAQGTSGAIMEIRGYNASSDDNAVSVSIAPALGVEGDAGLRLDGGDRWVVERGVSSDTSNAYVVKRTLVAAFPFATIAVGGAVFDAGPPAYVITQPPLKMELTEAVFVANISTDGTVLKGTLTGRWNVERMLKSIEAFPDPAQQSQHLCGDNQTYKLIQTIACGARDIAELSGGFACNALSFAIGFEARRAIAADAGDRADAGQPCGASWAPTCN